MHNYRSVCAAGTLFRDGKTCHDCLATPVLPAIRHSCYHDRKLGTVPVALATRPGGSLNKIPRKAARVVALNSSMQEQLSSVFSRPIDLVPNFVSIDPSAANIHGGTWVYVGRLSEEKGILPLVENWPSGAQLQIFGDGPQMQEIKSMRAGKDDIQLMGTAPHRAVMESLSTARGLVMPSLCTEGLPTVMLEALAVGIPALVSTRVAAGGQFVSAGTAEWLDMDSISSASLSNNLNSVAGKFETMSARCASLFEQEFSSTVWLRRMDAIYRSIAS